MVSNLIISTLSDGHFLLSWDSDAVAPVFRIFRDGILIATQALSRYRATVAPGEFPVFEVLDNEEGDPQPVYPSYVQIGWYVDPQVVSYDVQQYIDSVWTSRNILLNDGRSGYLLWKSPALADGIIHRFRVVPMGASGNAGTPSAANGLIVRYPDPPQVSFTFDPDDATVTIE